MIRFKSMIYLLSFLLFSQPILHGCAGTNLGYYSGKATDIETSTESYEISIDEVEKGDYVILSLVGVRQRRGKIISVKPEQEIIINLFNPVIEFDSAIDDYDDYDDIGYELYKTRQVYKWNEIEKIEKMIIGNQFRKNGFKLGLLVDMFFFFVIFILPFVH